MDPMHFTFSDLVMGYVTAFEWERKDYFTLTTTDGREFEVKLGDNCYAEIIRNLGEDSHTFLVKQGHRSAIAKFDLSTMPDMLHIISGSIDNVELLDAIRAEVGDDPEVWEPILLQRIAERRATIRKSQEAA